MSYDVDEEDAKSLKIVIIFVVCLFLTKLIESE